MIVGDQDEVDRRKILEAQGRRREALDTHQPAEGTAALVPVRIGEEIHPVELDEEGRVADPCHGSLVHIVPERPQIGSHGGEGSHP